MINSLRILGKTYNVSYIDPSPLTNEYKGKIDCCKQTIIVDHSMSAEHITETLLHEAIQALDYDAQLELSERQVHALGALVLCLLRDNPELLNAISGEEPDAQTPV